MQPGPEPELGVLRLADKFIHAAQRAEVLLEADHGVGRLGERRVDQHAARRDQGEQRVLVERQLVLVTDEEAEPRVEPVRIHGGDDFRGLAAEGVVGVAPRRRLARVAARSHHGSDPLVERRREDGGLPVARVAAERDLRGLHLGQRHEVVDRPARRPRPAGQHAEVVFRIHIDEALRIVALAVVRIGAVIDAAHVTPRHRARRPGPRAVVIGQEDRPFLRPGRNQQLDPQGRAVSGPELQPHIADGHIALFPLAGHDRTEVVRGRREPTGHPVLELYFDFLTPLLPFVARLHAGERVGQERIRRHRRKIRRQFARAPLPLFKGVVVDIDPAVPRHPGRLEHLQRLETGAPACFGRGIGAAPGRSPQDRGEENESPEEARPGRGAEDVHRAEGKLEEPRAREGPKLRRRAWVGRG